MADIDASGRGDVKESAGSSLTELNLVDNPTVSFNTIYLMQTTNILRTPLLMVRGPLVVQVLG